MASKPRARRARPAAGGRRSASGRLTSPSRPETRAATYTSPPVDISFAGPEHRFERADLEISGIAHGEASYEGRIFLNNPTADAETPETIDQGYAGSFHIFGHGGCTGDAGHCEQSGARRGTYDRRNPHPLTPARKSVSVTEALKTVALAATTATVTIVPVVSAANEFCNTQNVFSCQGMRFVSYNG